MKYDNDIILTKAINEITIIRIKVPKDNTDGLPLEFLPLFCDSIGATGFW